MVLWLEQRMMTAADNYKAPPHVHLTLLAG